MLLISCAYFNMSNFLLPKISSQTSIFLCFSSQMGVLCVPEISSEVGSPELALLSGHYTKVTELSDLSHTTNLLLLAALCSFSVCKSQIMQWKN